MNAPLNHTLAISPQPNTLQEKPVVVPPAVDKLWTTCATHFASIKKSDETFLKEKGLEILTNWGVDPAAMQRRAVRRDETRQDETACQEGKEGRT